MEYNFKHTPGPWIYNHETNEVRTVDGYYIAYADVDTPKYAEQEIANAKLIAAAPDLLVALKELRNQLLTIKMNIPQVMPLQNEQINMLSAALFQSEKAMKKATE